MTNRIRNWLGRWIVPFVDPRRLAALALLPRFFVEMKRFRALAPDQSVPWSETYPCLLDRLDWTPFDPHYFFQAAWLVRKLARTKPSLHVDVGSSVMMINVVSAIVPLVFLDYRPLKVCLSGLQSIAGNAVSLPFRDESISSLSCLHVIEHVGLGRYGDPLDPLGAQRAAQELERVLKPGGHLFLSVPVGRERVCFNAHRVYAPATIRSFMPTLRLKSFALVDDSGRYHEAADEQKAIRLEYGCGLFEFVKLHG